MKKIGLKYSFYDNNIPFKKVSDNGLLLVTNKKSDMNGSYAFKHCLFDDSLANKGFIWLYYKTPKHILIINTHLQAAGDGTERYQQLGEIKQFINDFKDKYKESQELKIIVIGDMNVDMKNHFDIVNYKKQKQKLISNNNDGDFSEKCKYIDEQIAKLQIRKHRCKYIPIPELLGSEFRKINSCSPTFYIEKWGCLDHIITNFDIEQKDQQILGKEPNLSDHYLILYKGAYF